MAEPTITAAPEITTSSKPPVVTAPIPTTNVLGIHFHCVRMTDVLELVKSYIAQKLPRQLCLVNAYTLSVALKDAEFSALLSHADLVLADGMSIVWGGRGVGAQIPQRVAGPDLMKGLCKEAVQHGYRIFLLGSTQENLTTLVQVIKRDNPGIIIAGTYSPSFCTRLSTDETRHILDLLKNAAADILFVGMSAPKQEKWIAENLPNMPVPVSIGVGAAFDFISGKIPRAPLGLQRMGLEWAYRLYREPRRLWKRYLLGNIVFLSGVVWQKIKYKISKTLTPSH